MSRPLASALLFHLGCFISLIPQDVQGSIINYEDPAGCNWWWHKDLELDFLDLTETEGSSYLHAKNLLKLDAEFRSEGWQLATQQQAYDLYKSFYDGPHNGVSADKLEAAQLWFSLFGMPHYSDYGVYTWKTLAGIEDATVRCTMDRLQSTPQDTILIVTIMQVSFSLCQMICTTTTTERP